MYTYSNNKTTQEISLYRLYQIQQTNKGSIHWSVTTTTTKLRGNILDHCYFLQ